MRFILNMKTIKIILISLALVCLSATISAQSKDSNSKQNHKVHWSYIGNTGPEHWSEIDPAFSLCSGGSMQSPVDLSKAKTSNLERIKFAYKEMPVDLINNGHTIQENVAKGSSAEIGGKIYQLIQFHFHTPSEHTVNGIHFDLEMHLVHKDNKGEYAVIGIFFKEGITNKELQKIIDNLPGEINKPYINNSQYLNIEKLLPANRSYYHYKGSLTTPPCSEQISWNIFKTPIEASAKQLFKLKSIMGNNSRPIQKLNNRIISESR